MLKAEDLYLFVLTNYCLSTIRSFALGRSAAKMTPASQYVAASNCP